MSHLSFEFVRLCLLAVFATLAARSWLRWRRGGGGEAAAWLTASFAVLAGAALCGILWADRLQHGQGTGLWKLAVGVALLFPYCLVRFTAVFRPDWRRWPLICGVVSGLVIAWTVAMPAPPA